MKFPLDPKHLRWFLIGAFIVAFGFGIKNAQADDFRIAFGAGFNHSEKALTSEVMYTFDNHVYLAATRIGGDLVLNPNHNQIMKLAGGYRVRWRDELKVSPYMRMGIAYFDHKPYLVMNDNVAFDMALGVRLWDIAELELLHNSTAGRSTRNWGLDYVNFGLVIPFN